jgi:hypothetical protein
MNETAWELSRQLAIRLGQKEAMSAPRWSESKWATEPGKAIEMPVLQATAGGGAKLDEGSYVVTCTAATQDHLENSLYGTGEVLRFTLKCADEVDENGDPVELDAIANLKLTPKSKLWSWAEAFGLKPEVGKSFDTDALIGLTALAVVKDKGNDDGSVFSRVENLMPLPKGYTAGATVMPSVILASGEPDWGVFWRVLKEKKGWAKAQVGDHLDLDMDKLGKHLGDMDGPDAQELLEVLLNTD